MKKFLSYIFVVAILLGFGGCATQQFVINESYMDQKDADDLEPKVDEQVAFFFSGILQTDTVNPAQVCGSIENVVKVESELTFGQGFLGVITMGIYTPRNVKVFCSKGNIATKTKRTKRKKRKKTKK